MSDTKVKVLFIGGFGRSGSTLLDQMLGQIEGFFSVGELRHIWDRGFAQDQLCGCGSTFKQCSFWNAVTKEAFGGLEHLNTEQIKALQHSVDRMRCIPQLASSRKTPNYRNRLSDYAQILAKLFKAIQKVSGCRIIVDSSKDPSHGYVLNAIPDIDLCTIHLVRDSRAVAFSWLREKPRPEIHWEQQNMPKYSPIKSAFYWNIMNLFMQTLKYITPRHVLLKYENLVNNPKGAINKILKDLYGIQPNPNFFDSRCINLQVNHTVSGNPIRFLRGILEIRPDIEWKNKMDGLQKLFVTILTLPLLLKYGYIGPKNLECNNEIFTGARHDRQNHRVGALFGVSQDPVS